MLAKLLANPGKVRHLRLVQRLDRTTLDGPRQVLAGGQHQVITAAPGEQFGFHGFQRIEVIGDHLNAGLRFKILQRIRGQVLAQMYRLTTGLAVSAACTHRGASTSNNA